MKDINIRDLQLAELEILKEFIRVCKELNLKYFLDSGTLLGCIRHNGFIPWDDDIDVSMPREDYEVFLKKGQSILKDKYFLQNYNTDTEYMQSFAKIRNSETTFIESTVKNLNINHGIYIDIFPFDGYNPKDKIQDIRFKVISILHKIYFSSKYVLINPERLKVKIMKIMQKVLKVTYRNKTNKDLLEKENNLAKKYKYEESKYVCSYAYNSPPPNKQYVPKEYFGEGVTKTFEGIDVNVPTNYDAILKRLYGDYMQLPPEEKRIPHHYNEGVDLNKPYEQYINKKEEDFV